MRTSTKGLEFIKRFEGLSLKAYKCAAGVWTIGWGHTGSLAEIGIDRNIFEGLVITREQATQLLKKDLIKYEKAVNDYVKTPLNQAQFDALVDFSFNCGTGALRTSTLLKRVNYRDTPDNITAAFKMWNKGGGKVLKGLTLRREAEAKLFNTGIYN